MKGQGTRWVQSMVHRTCLCYLNILRELYVGNIQTRRVEPNVNVHSRLDHQPLAP